MLTRQAREAVASLLPGRKRKFRKPRVSSGKLRTVGGRTVAGLWQDYYWQIIYRDWRSTRRQEEEEEEDNLTFVDRTDTALQMHYWYCWLLIQLILNNILCSSSNLVDSGYIELFWFHFVKKLLRKNLYNIIFLFSPLEIILRHIGLRIGKLELGLMDWLSGLKPNIMNNQYSSNGYYELSKGSTF